MMATVSNQHIKSLVESDRVNAAVYVDPEIFRLEMQRLWSRAWIYVGHESQVSRAGDYITTSIAAKPVIMVRHVDGSVQVLHNRCAHRGALLTSECSGNAKAFRCLYHGWAFNTDGSLHSRPKESGYDGTDLPKNCAAVNVRAAARVDSYRGFVFARLAADGPDLVTWLDVTRSSIDNLVDRSPAGELEITGGVLRYMHNCNWKLLVENISDNMHSSVTHQSAYQPAQKISKNYDEPNRRAPFDMLIPFGAPYSFFDATGLTAGKFGHSYSGGDVSIHSAYPEMPAYMSAMTERYGPAKTNEILSMNRHNTVIYPSVSIKCAVQTIRVYRPIAVDKTLQETWTLRLKGAPDEMLQRSILYNRLIFSPGSIAGHDDYEAYQRIMAALKAAPETWVNFQRLAGADDVLDNGITQAAGTSEMVFRSEYQAWLKYMLKSLPEEKNA